MAGRSRATFKKRQKELARVEKQRDKAARRLERKAGKRRPEDDPGIPQESTDAPGPLGNELGNELP